MTDHLVDEYAALIRKYTVGRDVCSPAMGAIESLSESGAFMTDAEALQRIRAVVAAAKLVRGE